MEFEKEMEKAARMAKASGKVLVGFGMAIIEGVPNFLYLYSEKGKSL